MMLVEQSTVPFAALPVAEFKDHLRLGTGFADDGVQDSLLEMCLRAAMAAIEARTGKVLFERTFLWTLTAWRDLGRQVLPVAPISAITQLSVVDRTAVETVVNPDRYYLAADGHRPALTASGFMLPTIPVGGTAEIQFVAGYGASFADIPADLGQAMLILSGHYYEMRHETGPGSAGMPMMVATLIERHRNVRVFGGGK